MGAEVPYEDDRGLFTEPSWTPQRVATSRYGMVATAHPHATEAGVEMLAAGGNAFDAAIAAALAIGVCEPHASGLGGQTMVLYHDAAHRETVALDGSSRAPERATPETVPEERRFIGHRATTVPSTPATLHHLVQEKATLPLSDLMAPAIRIAEDGYKVSALQHRIQQARRDALREAGGARFFLNGRRPFEQGEVHRQETLAGTLRRLAGAGLTDFYDGQVGQSILADMEKNDGLITARDLAHVPHPVARLPDLGKWRGKEVASFPPPGAGRVLLELLHILERSPKRLHDPETVDGAVFFARSIKQALMDHNKEPRDPARHQMTAHQMIQHDHAHRLAVSLRQGLPGETTHLSVLDREGNAVGLTQSIELFYGACVAAPDLGILYNNYISAFARSKDLSHPYALRPNNVPWSCVAPAIVFSRKRPVLVIGSPGSDRIAPAVAQVMTRLSRMAPMDAVEAPRLHAGLDNTATLETPRFRTDIVDALEADGFDVAHHDAYSLFHGCVQLAMRQGRDFVGVADPRRDGSAGGPEQVPKDGRDGRDGGYAAMRRWRPPRPWRRWTR